MDALTPKVGRWRRCDLAGARIRRSQFLKQFSLPAPTMGSVARINEQLRLLGEQVSLSTTLGEECTR